jgi:hypothetical protein
MAPCGLKYYYLLGGRNQKYDSDNGGPIKNQPREYAVDGGCEGAHVESVIKPQSSRQAFHS